MSLYFRRDGSVNYRNLTMTSMTLTSLYIATFVLGQGRAEDNGIATIEPSTSAMTADRVLYWKLKPSPKKMKDLKGKLVAMRNPYDPYQVLYRRVIATELFWIQRQDDSGLIQVPRGHVWLECDYPTKDNLDSISKFGPVSTGLLLGEVSAIIWPP